MKNKKEYLIMFLAFFIYSLSSVFSKIASKFDIFSINYLLCFLGIILVLGVYAVLWQQILKNIELSIAMSFKPLCLVLSVMWSIILFSEHLSLKTITGIVLVILGIFIISRAEYGK
jgi:multidrug transporter EmrE-like cation transporter